MNNIDELDREVNGLLAQLDDALDRIELQLSPEDRRAFFTRLSLSNMPVFDRLLGIKHQEVEGATADDVSRILGYSGRSNVEDLSQNTTASEPSISCSDTRSHPSSSSPMPSSPNQDPSKSGKGLLDDTGFSGFQLSMPRKLRELLAQFAEQPELFWGIIGRRPPTGAGLHSAFFELYDRGEDAGLLEIYRRFELRNFYLLAVNLDYHTGERWCRNASSKLAKEIARQRPSLDMDEKALKEYLDEYVRLGRKYDRWATDLGGPGYLIALPLCIKEREYTDRHYSKFIPSAIAKFREEGIDQIVTESGYDRLGDHISDGLWAQFSPSQASLRRPLTKSARRNKRKRENGHNQSTAVHKRARIAGGPETYRGFGGGTSGSSENGQSHSLEVTSGQAAKEQHLSNHDILSPNSEEQNLELTNSPTHTRAPESMASIDPESSADFPDELGLMASIDPEASADFADTLGLMASIDPEASADFPDTLGLMASIDPEASADFPDALGLLASIDPEATADFPDTLGLMASIDPEASADFPDALGLLASIDPEATADFPDALGLMASIDPVASADFPDAVGMIAPITCGPGPSDATYNLSTSRISQDESSYHRNDEYLVGALIYT